MKKLHIHISVPDLAESIIFYTGLFDSEPNKIKSNYAKWDLEDPRVNFAISTRNQKFGISLRAAGGNRPVWTARESP